MKRMMIALVATLFVMSLLMTPVVAVETAEVVPQEKTMLWNGRDFTGWKRFLPDASKNVDVTCTSNGAGRPSRVITACWSI